MQWVIGIVVLLVIIGSCSDKSDNSSSASSSAAKSYATSITESCAREAGIPTGSSHAITPSEMRDFTSCVDRKK